MKRILVLVLGIVTFFQIIAFAEYVPNGANMSNNVSFATEGRTTNFDNGLSVYFSSVPADFDLYYYSSSISDPNCYWTYMLGKPIVLAAKGVQVELTNNSDEMMVIKWSESSLEMGTFNGMPFLNGMACANAGNPSATPDSIIPPHKTITIDLLISDIKYEGAGWEQKKQEVKVDGSLNATIYMKVIGNNGSSSYFTAKSPSIILVK